ncbi:hypothetical protein JN01_0633 [Entomoplasma freundtii]|uniref:Uncharacterized protein n=1 Tax=Entomoplasma freundtii TaxID=74700 RepID=A0A2K8NRB2_9MOLU|nr:hypothetical protein [Entomoplasma freundtii]ATZ16327.1 hypothetical protein EFREU_v1c03010 [Entomoplasma freundtii]TDY56634.1 hypothetical protein JN01_0633 [Entomoplasma freundtii]
MKRNIVFLSMAFISLACFIIAVLGFGFESTSKVIDLVDIKKIEDAKNGVDGANIGVDTWYLKTSYGLMVSGLALTTIAILMGTMITYFQPTKVRLVRGIGMWDQIFITFLVFASVAMILTGEMYFMTQYLDKEGAGAKFSDFWKVGPMVGMIIFTVLPLFFMIAPFFVKDEAKRKKSHASTTGTKSSKKATTHKKHRANHNHTTTTETLIIA